MQLSCGDRKQLSTKHGLIYMDERVVTVKFMQLLFFIGYQEWLIVHSSKLIIFLASLATIEGVIISIIVIILIGAVCRYYYKKRSNSTAV